MSCCSDFDLHKDRGLGSLWGYHRSSGPRTGWAGSSVLLNDAP